MKKIILFLFLVLFISNIQAQPFSLDTSFKPNYNFNHYTIGGTVLGLNIETDGKLLIYGSFWNSFNTSTSDIIRLYEDGSLDNSWFFSLGSQGGSPIGFVKKINNKYIISLPLLNIGKFDYYGMYTDTAWLSKIYNENICRKFYTPYVFNDGGMLVGGDTNCNNISNKKKSLMRFLPDGNIDTTFKHNTDKRVEVITKYSSDKLLLNGSFTKYDTNAINYFCRIDTSGTLDTTFKSIFIGGRPIPLYIQNDGKIIIGGYFNIPNYFPNYIYIIRLNTNGSLDSTFNNFNNAINCHGITSACPTTDGGYLIGGEFNQYQANTRHNIVKTDANGFIDTVYFNGFGIDSVYHNNDAYVGNIVKGNNDTYYIMGYFTYYNGVKVQPVIRLHGLFVGIKENEKEDIEVYPNPANNQICFNKITFKDYQISIFNAIGQCVLKQHSKNTTTLVNIQVLKQGIYLYKLTDKLGKVINGKFIKQ